MIVSSVNFSLGFMLAIQFGAIWLIIGAFGSRTTYYLVLGGCVFYIIFSIVFLLKSIYNVIKGSKIIKNIIMLFILGFILYFGLTFYNTYNRIINKSVSSNDNIIEKLNINI